MSHDSPGQTLSESFGVVQMPMESPIATSSAIGGTRHAPMSPLLTLAAVASASAGNRMSPIASPAASQSQRILSLPEVDTPMSATSDPRRTKGKKRGKGKDKATDAI